MLVLYNHKPKSGGSSLSHTGAHRQKHPKFNAELYENSGTARRPSRGSSVSNHNKFAMTPITSDIHSMFRMPETNLFRGMNSFHSQIVCQLDNMFGEMGFGSASKHSMNRKTPKMSSFDGKSPPRYTVE